MDCAQHGCDGAALLEGDGVAQVLVVGEGVVLAVLDYPPCVGAPEETPVVRDGAVQVEGRGEVGELEAVVQVERRRELRAHAEPFAVREAIADQRTPVGAFVACVEVHACGKVLAQAILESRIGLQAVDAGPDLQGRIAVKLAVAHGSREIGNLGDGIFC